MREENYNYFLTIYKIDQPFDVRVEWYTGDVTVETVLAESGSCYFFEFIKNKSWYAPKDFCKQIKY